jgi:hypothetical protein
LKWGGNEFMSETITIKLTITGESDGILLETAQWLQKNRDRAIAAIQESFKSDIAIYSQASDEQIYSARLEALAYHEYRAKVLHGQVYGDRQSVLTTQPKRVDRECVDRAEQLEQHPTIDPALVVDNETLSNGRSSLTIIELDPLKNL